MALPVEGSVLSPKVTVDLRIRPPRQHEFEIRCFHWSNPDRSRALGQCCTGLTERACIARSLDRLATVIACRHQRVTGLFAARIYPTLLV